MTGEVRLAGQWTLPSRLKTKLNSGEPHAVQGSGLEGRIVKSLKLGFKYR
jgi:hypothetical protein